jgi:mRNA-degrading endonuclease RelE of RelBE toxin-antitoxin system
MVVLKTKNYIKSTESLQEKELVLLLKQEKLLEKDIFSNNLHTKKLLGFGNDLVYSFRITRSYRGIFRIQENQIILFAIGHRKEVYRDL